ncbi:dual specificity protein phosphatase [uncultured Thiodictyon sp.]|uniref:dual specificity protein phosphatase family protein n=1 Tax=uncultured Thiodictyon sp. TaxID=1846217 RepID=UPI0025E14BE9|nr:dual specificity protein phosphatase [uncultured Thiodictyon sp.]
MSIDFITDHLAVGGRDEAQAPGLLRAAGIGFVLSLAPVAVTGPRQVYLAVADREPLPGATIAQAVGLIAAQIAVGRRVLVHCQMGISRSPAIAVCYLRQCRGLTIPRALAAVVRARPQAQPHPALLDSIYAHFDDEGPIAASASDSPRPPAPTRPA